MHSAYTNQDHDDPKRSLNGLRDEIDERLQLVLNEQNNFDSDEEDADGTHAF